MMIISRNTGTSYVELIRMPYSEIDRIFDALIWVIEGENRARKDAIREAESRAKQNGER